MAGFRRDGHIILYEASDFRTSINMINLLASMAGIM